MCVVKHTPIFKSDDTADRTHYSSVKVGRNDEIQIASFMMVYVNNI